jgi:hypothetical protein
VDEAGGVKKAEPGIVQEALRLGFARICWIDYGYGAFNFFIFVDAERHENSAQLELDEASALRPEFG